MFDRKRPVQAADLLQHITKRAEDLTADEQARSFVSVRRIGGALESRDSRVIFGRRGTGKTHILSYMSRASIARGEASCFIDLRTIGSNNSIYSDEIQRPHIRATVLIRDLITAIQYRLLEAYTDSKSNFKGKGIDSSLEALAGCIRTVVVNETLEARGKISNDETSSLSAGGSAEVSPLGAKAHLRADAATSEAERSEWETTTKGTPRLSLNMGSAYNCFREIAERSQRRIWIYLDEWSSIPEPLQPYLADFVRRAIIPIQNMTIVIAAVEYRSRFRVDFSENRVGLELGSDIAADINLDDYFVYDSSPNATVEFFRNILYRHLEAFAGENGLVEQSPQEVVNNIFSQDRVFNELSRASEGVARDFINILQLATMRSDANKISMNEIRTAAKDWYERDKLRNIDTHPRAQELLQWIRDKVISGKKARAFLLHINQPDQTIEYLFDERVLHIARRSYSAKDRPGERYRVWKVDYGSYVDLMTTKNDPTGFLFEGSVMEEDGNIIVPDDDYRAVRRSILDIEKFYLSVGQKQ